MVGIIVDFEIVFICIVLCILGNGVWGFGFFVVIVKELEVFFFKWEVSFLREIYNLVFRSFFFESFEFE